MSFSAGIFQVPSFISLFWVLVGSLSKLAFFSTLLYLWNRIWYLSAAMTVSKELQPKFQNSNQLPTVTTQDFLSLHTVVFWLFCGKFIFCWDATDTLLTICWNNAETQLRHCWDASRCWDFLRLIWVIFWPFLSEFEFENEQTSRKI